MPTIQPVWSCRIPSSRGSAARICGDHSGTARSTGIAATNQSASTVAVAPERSIMVAVGRDGTHRVPHECLAHDSDGSGGDDRGPGRDELPGQRRDQDVAVALRLRVALERLGPGLVFPFPIAAFEAAGEEHDELAQEYGELVRRDRAAERECRGQRLLQRRRVVDVGAQWRDRRRCRRVRCAGQGEPEGIARDEIVEDAIPVAGERDSSHRVGNVLVEARENRNPCSPGRSSRPPAPVPGDGMLRALPPSAVGS